VKRDRFAIVVRVGTLVLALMLGVVVHDGVARAAVVKDTADSTWQTNGRVRAIVLGGGRIYLGGDFTRVRAPGAPSGGAIRNHLAALDAATGALLPWNPNANGAVLALRLKSGGDTIYVGGAFTSIGGRARIRLAAVATHGAALRAWSPRANGRVDALTATAKRVYVGGFFTSIDSVSRARLAAVSTASTAKLLRWRAAVRGGGVRALALAAGRGRLFVGGSFVTVNGNARPHLAAIDTTTATIRRYGARPSWPVTSLVATKTSLFVGGSGTRGEIATYAATNGTRRWLAITDSAVHALTPRRGLVYVGGAFTRTCRQGARASGCTTSVFRRHLLALNTATGSLAGWNPGTDGVGGVLAMQSTMSQVDAGGDFMIVHGAAHEGVGKFSPGGAVTTIAPPTTLSATAVSATRVDLSWSASRTAGVSGYHIFRAGAALPIATVTAPTTAYSDTGLNASTTYTFTVTAFSADGESPRSNQATATTPSGGDTRPPSVPLNVSAVARSATSVTVTWAASSDNVAVAGYDVYRGGSKVATVTGTATSYTDSAVQPGMTYAYTVDAFDAVPNTSNQSSAANATTPAGTTGGGPAEPIIIIMMENKPYSDIVANSNAPYIQSLIAGGTLYTNYQAGPGSLPDYLAMTSGLTGSTSGSNNIFNQLQVKGVSWGEYEESMPSVCYTGGDTGSYKKGHNPAVYYNDITSSGSACANVMPYSQFAPSHLRAFSYVVPNLSNDMHDGSSRTAEIQAGDAWLAANVPAMLNAGAEVILTWDEGNSSDEHVATIAVGGRAVVGATDSHAYTHPGLLAGLEDAWGLARLNAAQTANPFPIH
jgi:chitodextrinase